MATRQIQSRSLPAKASEEYLRKEAKRCAKLNGLNLVAAQRALAHEYGHRNWAELISAAKTVLRPAETRRRPNPESSASAGTLALHDKEWTTIETLAGLRWPKWKSRIKEWLDNRKSFPEWGEAQQQFVATSGDQIVGYAAAEHPPVWMRNKAGSEGEYRLFVVIEPSSRPTLGTRLLDALARYLVDHGARRAWFQEYEADKGLVSFLEQNGFVKRISFTAENGDRIVRLSMEAPFERLMPPALSASGPRASALGEEGRR
jgi:GNAT superfamily N-acetyltransferase